MSSKYVMVGSVTNDNIVFPNVNTIKGVTQEGAMLGMNGLLWTGHWIGNDGGQILQSWCHWWGQGSSVGVKDGVV